MHLAWVIGETVVVGLKDESLDTIILGQESDRANDRLILINRGANGIDVLENLLETTQSLVLRIVNKETPVLGVACVNDRDGPIVPRLEIAGNSVASYE